jgi:hypothetical protein
MKKSNNAAGELLPNEEDKGSLLSPAGKFSFPQKDGAAGEPAPKKPKEAADALVSCTCVRNLLDSIHGSHAYFTPTPRFYEVAGINSRRWAKLYRGELSISIDELKRLCHALNVTFSAETFLRQLRLFD